MRKKLLAMVIMLCILFCSTSIEVDGATEQWVTEDFKLPVSMRGACVEYVDGKMYVIGGELATTSSNQVHIYDFKKQIWTTGTSMKNKRGNCASALIDNKIYVAGGDNLLNSKLYTTNQVEIYDTISDTWTTGSPMPFARDQASSIVIGSKLYIFGGAFRDGTNFSVHNEVQIYDLINDTWTTGTNMPFERRACGIGSVDGKIFLIGGNNGTAYYKDVSIFDIVSNSWSKGTPMKEERAFPASITHNNEIYLFGGTKGNPLNTTEIYNVIEDEWRNGTNLTVPKRTMSTVVINNKVYLVGGQVTNDMLNTIESLQLPPADNRLFAHLYINEKTQLSFTHSLADNQSISWKSSTPRVASVDSDGVVTALELGTTYISTYNQNGTFIDYIPVIVTESDEYRMAVHLISGQTQKLYMKGNPIGITWSSMDTNVAAVDNNGLVTVGGKGLAIIKAELNGEEHYIYARVN